jgi:hypothetical protein
MTLAGNDPGSAVPGPELGHEDLARLLKASGWARFIAVASLVFTGAMTLALAGLTFQALRVPAARNFRFVLGLIVTPASLIAGAVLLWGYARGVVSFIRQGQPTLAQAFRRRRRFFQLWIALVAYGIVSTIVALLGQR